MTRYGGVNGGSTYPPSQLSVRYFSNENKNDDDKDKPTGFEQFLKRTRRSSTSKQDENGPAAEPVSKDDNEDETKEDHKDKKVKSDDKEKEDYEDITDDEAEAETEKEKEKKKEKEK
jgi:hypothetical protein